MNRKKLAMKTKFSLIAAMLVIASFAMGRATADRNPQLHQQTISNLLTAAHGEAFAYAKYMLYAQYARKTGRPDLADLFEKTATMERLEHFADEAELIGLVGRNAENIHDAMKGESYEVDTMYLNFAQQAAALGDKVAADRFEEIREDEMKHLDAFKSALTRIKSTDR
jgi:rubrerythrin